MTEITHLALYNPANTRWKKFNLIFIRFCKLNVIGSERRYMKIDMTANHIPELKLGKHKLPSLFMYDKHSEFTNYYRNVEVLGK